MRSARQLPSGSGSSESRQQSYGSNEDDKQRQTMWDLASRKNSL